jgi:hypothetical protein
MLPISMLGPIDWKKLWEKAKQVNDKKNIEKNLIHKKNSIDREIELNDLFIETVNQTKILSCYDVIVSFEFDSKLSMQFEP